MTRSRTEIIPALTTMALFAGTALLSQILQHRLNKQKEIVVETEDEAAESELEDEGSDDIVDLREMYIERRRTARLSYGDLNEFQPSQRKTYVSNEMSSSEKESKRHDDYEPPFDFHPKNSNWCHFERYSEEDVKKGLVTLSEEEDDDDDDVSTSSSEGFLWTQATRTQRRRESSKSSLCERSSIHKSSVKSMTVAPLPEFDELGESAYAGDEADAHLPRSPLVNQPSTGVRRYSSDPEYRIKGIDDSGQSARARYNARIMPNQVIMVRHGQSEGNMNEDLYSVTPDNAMRITRLGWEQARKAGEILKEKVIESGESVHFIVSPYVRTVETFHGIVSAWCDPKEFGYIKDREKRIKAWYKRLLEMGLTWHEDPRIREQDFGNYQIPEKIKQYKRERHQFGPFFYRFPHGESASDVFDRVSTFLDSLWRSFDLNRSKNYVLVTHGISIRVLLARYFRYSIEQFNRLANPRNCEMVLLRHDGIGKLQLDGRCELELEKNEDTGEVEVTGYEFRRRLRVLPQQYIRTLNVRICPDDDIPDNRSVLQNGRTEHSQHEVLTN